MTVLLGIPHAAVITIVSFLMFAEASLAVGLVLPGASAVILLGVSSHTGCFSYFITAASVALASTAGAQLAFIRFARSGRAHARLPKQPMTSTLMAAFTNHFFGGMRTLSPRVLAQAGSRYPAFAAVNTVAAAVWATLLVTVGRYADSLSWLTKLGSIVAIPVVIALLIWQLGQLMRKRGMTYSGVIQAFCRDPKFATRRAIAICKGQRLSWRLLI